MRVTSIEVHTKDSADVIVLSLRDPRRLNSYNITSIFGLDADEILPMSYKGYTAKFYELMLKERNIVMRVSLNPGFGEAESYSSLRDRLYRVISSSRAGVLDIKFKNGDVVVATTSGLLTKFEAPLSTKTPEVQFTISCSDPRLYGNRLEVDIIGLDMADFSITDAVSTAPHGFKFRVLFTADTESFSLSDPASIEHGFTVSPFGGFLDSDVLSVSSEQNDKYVKLIRSSVTSHIADAIEIDSSWPLVFPGVNNFTVPLSASMIMTFISYRPTFWGV